MDARDKEVIEELAKKKKAIEESLEKYQFRFGLSELMDVARMGNKYMQEKQPWILAKELPANPNAQKGIDNCIHICLQLCANLAVMCNPFLPNTARKMLHMMKVVEKMLDWENAGKMKLLSVGYSLREPQLLFRKIEDDEIKYQIEKLKSGIMSSAENQQQPTGDNQPPIDNKSKIANLKSEIIYDDFAKLDLRVATVIACEKVAKADKLLKLEVDLGTEKRTIVSGIAQHYKPEEMVGKQVVVVTNLAPRKMKGIESQGMILTAEDSDGKLQLLKPENNVSPGSNVS
jgi:methionyl-tRNA synthetase